MKAILPKPTTSDGIFVWIMHRFAQVFEDHAILKGGMALRLLDSHRSTTDIDYVFVPYKSKKQILPRIRTVLDELTEADIKVTLHSKMLRAEVAVGDAAVQIEASVGLKCEAIPMSTGKFAEENDQPSQIVRMMSLDCAFAHKLAAWNERRLLRDLYDCYFFSDRLNERPNLQILDARFAAIDSKLPRLRTKKKMSRSEFCLELREAVATISDKAISIELQPLLPPEELAGLAIRMRATLSKLADELL